VTAVSRRLRTAARAIRTVIREVNEDNAVDAAASVAFWLLLSLPATLLAGLAALSLLGEQATEELRRLTFEFVDRVFTSEADELRTAIDGVFDQNKAGLFSLSVLLALFTVSRGFAGLIRALDVVYDIEESRGFIRLRVASIGLGIGTIATVVGSTWLWNLSSNAGVPLAFRLVAALAILVVWAATIFHVGPNHHTPWRYDLPGAALAAVGWLVVSVGYGWYIQIAGGGNAVLGLAGALLLGMTWFWVVCLILLVGGEVNEIIAARAGVVVRNRASRLDLDSRAIASLLVRLRHPRRRPVVSRSDDHTEKPTGDQPEQQRDDDAVE
jgi:membrane protein